MQHTDIHAVVGKRLGGLQGAHRQEARRDDQGVLAIADQLRPAEFELISILIENDWYLAAQKAHIDRAMMGRDSGHHLLNLMRVTRIDHSHVWHGPEERQIFGRLMAWAVSGGEARQCADDLYVSLFFGDRL